MTDKTTIIRELNDSFRKSPTRRDHFVTNRIASLPITQQNEIAQLVHAYADFTPDNDPYGEHDFGVFTYNGLRILWKIDYYDWVFGVGSDDPADAEKTRRVLVIMLADEY